MLPRDWASLIALMDGHPTSDPVARIERLCGLCVESTGVSGVAVGIRSKEARSTVWATDEVSARLEELQSTVGEGPSIEAESQGWSVMAPDLAADSEQRWPWFRQAALEAGARAMFVLPLKVAALRLGVLALYRTSPGELDAEHLRDAGTLADAASVLLTLDQPGEHTAQAFMWVVGDRSRFHPEVHQAVGFTMVELGLDARDAFARIGAHAYAEGREILEVADDIVARRLRLGLG